MGLLDNVKGLLGGSGKTTEPILLEAGENEQARTVACTVKGSGLPWVGGDLVLTDRRLLFTPLNVKDVAPLLSYGLKAAGVPSVAVALVGRVQSQIRPGATELAEVTSVTSGRSAGLLHPPTLLVNRADGESIEFGVLASRTTPNFSGANERARDDFLAQLEAVVQ